MRLSEALSLGRHEVVALVGAGGKTTALYQLAHDLLAAGQRVLVTTTTHMRPPDPAVGWPVVLADEDPAWRERVTAQIAEHGRAFVAGAYLAPDKLRGISADAVQSLSHWADAVLVEADGARGLAIKAPAAHEPVVPPCATLVVPVVGLAALGQQLGPAIAHRPELLAELWSGLPGEVVDAPRVVRLLLSEQGALKGVPSGARVIALLNQAETLEQVRAGRAIARQVLAHNGRIRQVALGALQSRPEETERWRPAAVIVLAAGEGRRFGALKQAVEWDGQPLLVRAARAASKSLAVEVHIVLGCASADLRSMLATAGLAGLQVHDNPAWTTGVASSIRCGLQALGERVQATVFCNADQPLLSEREIDALLVRAAQTGSPVVAPFVDGELRSPVLFSRDLFPVLAALEGDRGGRAIALQHCPPAGMVAVAGPLPYEDIDAASDLGRLRRLEWDGNRS